MHIKCINLTNNTISVIFYSVSFVNVALENEQQITFFSGLSVGHSPIQQVAVADTTPPTADMLAGDAHGRPWTPAAFLSTHTITGTVLLLWRAHESFCLIIRTLWPHMTEIAGQQISCIKLKTKNIWIQSRTTAVHCCIVSSSYALVHWSEQLRPVAAFNVTEAGVVLDHHITIADLLQRTQAEMIQVRYVQSCKTDGATAFIREVKTETLFKGEKYIFSLIKTGLVCKEN